VNKFIFQFTKRVFRIHFMSFLSIVVVFFVWFNNLLITFVFDLAVNLEVVHCAAINHAWVNLSLELYYSY